MFKLFELPFGQLLTILIVIAVIIFGIALIVKYSIGRVGKAMEGAGGTLQGAGETLKGAGGTLQGAGGAIDKVGDGIGGALKQTSDGVNKLLGGIGGGINNLGEGTKNILTSLASIPSSLNENKKIKIENGIIELKKFHFLLKQELINLKTLSESIEKEEEKYLQKINKSNENIKKINDIINDDNKNIFKKLYNKTVKKLSIYNIKKENEILIKDIEMLNSSIEDKKTRIKKIINQLPELFKE